MKNFLWTLHRIKLLLIFNLVLVYHMVSAQSPLSSGLGNVKKINRFDPDKVSFTLESDHGICVVSIMSANVLRIRATKVPAKIDMSYAVVAKPVMCDFDYAEDQQSFQIKTDSLILKIKKNPLRLTFTTLEGRVINEDDPSFGISWNGTEVTRYMKLFNDEKFLGLGEKGGDLNRRGSAYVNWNTDNPNHQNYSDPLYASIPFYIGLQAGLAYGIFFDNSFKSYFNFGASNDRFSSFAADDGEMDFYFIYHKNVSDIISTYTWLTGRMTMPPLWSLGFQQCRWSYFPDSEVLNLARTFREKKIPCDVIYLDIHHMDAYKVFTWHPDYFPYPKSMIGELKKMNFHTAVIIDPGIKVEKGYHAYDQGVKNNFFVKYPDQTDWTAQVWPGWCHFPDFTSPEVRKWWGSQFKGYIDTGVEGFWNDMNEIATWGQQPPNNIVFNWEGKKTTYREAKNVYGMQMARSTYEGTRNLLGKRPLIITRAGFAGLQRYTSIWTGDNQATDEHMLLGVRLVNSLGLSGVSFTGMDIGGFSGNPTKQLFARWITLGTFIPFFRAHASIDTKSAEPWAFGEDVELISKNYIQLRYKLLPYLYSAFYESFITGIPVNRSMVIEYTGDEKVYDKNFQNQFLHGPSLLVIPVESTKLITKAWLPAGGWYDIYTDSYFPGNNEVYSDCPLDKLPIFAKAGAIIPVQSNIQHTSENPSDTLDLHIYYNHDKNLTSFRYYEDDGNTYDYEKNLYYSRIIKYDPAINEIIFEKKEGTYSTHFKHIRLILHQFEKLSNIQKVNDSRVILNELTVNFQYPAEVPWWGGDAGKVLCKSIVIDNSDSRMVVDL